MQRFVLPGGQRSERRSSSIRAEGVTGHETACFSMMVDRTLPHGSALLRDEEHMNANITLLLYS